MFMNVLRDVYLAGCFSRHPFSLKKDVKLTRSHFDENNRSLKMKTKFTAQTLSGTMVKCLDEVISGKIDLVKIPEANRPTALSKIRQFCVHMNRWFDLCNSKDTTCQNDFRIWVKTSNGEALADEFLSILKFSL